jgi:hypothetical protein
VLNGQASNTIKEKQPQKLQQQQNHCCHTAAEAPKQQEKTLVKQSRTTPKQDQNNANREPKYVASRLRTLY